MDVVRLHQAGIGYAVATLGTSTTPEHLKRAFRLVREVIFCFDGDKAGRAAAWRALGNALPEAQAGREIKFLFLPEGEDPDSLVGKEGKTAFERRLTDAVPLPKYFGDHFRDAIDTKHADGKARLVAEAWPLLERIPTGGPYRELLEEYFARELGLTRERMLQMVRAGIRSEDSSAPGTVVGPRGSTQSAGRGGLVRQSVQNLLHFPSIASRLGNSERSGLDAVTEPGIEVLRDLLDTLQGQPAQNAAQLLERWRDHPLAERLARLAAEPSMLENEQAAGDELVNAARELARATKEAELNRLIEKDENGWLSETERQRLLELLKTTRRG
jgi:DNA primase